MSFSQRALSATVDPIELTIANLMGTRAAISSKRAVRNSGDLCSAFNGPITRSLPATNS